MTTILSIVQDIAEKISVFPPTAVASPTEETGKQFRVVLHDLARDLIDKVFWPELQKEYTFTLGTSQANYAFPNDFKAFLTDTIWSRSDQWPLIGPMTPQQWQTIKSGLLTVRPFQRFRVKGISNNQIYIDPTPSSSDNGKTIVFEYISDRVFRPKTWVTSTTFAAGSYCFYDGNYYSTVSGGVTGATPPTHTTGSASDGGVTWVYYSGSYSEIIADTDEIVIDESTFRIGLEASYLESRGFSAGSAGKLYNDMLARRSSDKTIAGILPLTGKKMFGSYGRVPDGGWTG